ncbi:hypothetical protein BDK51DRAFT_20274 [Blyttiomyces helicus]|uniref:Probable glycerol kinase n=1 Tax=Blyttiomyces helicus TaxID=388810 RepID=A0A4P9WQJ7_9FUNG|nr:hypothetical protein BDK51DRAFT_20274 [Blyttiomyces helicus]|eukprot:RKO93490.1 hypothetical protein BDK51DRAFT_20274 [Blyttiomyces helicus]
MATYIGAIDQGTSSSRFMVFDKQGNIVESHQTEFPQYYPDAGWCEHDPIEILDSVTLCINETVEKMKARGLNPADIKAVGITNQRETTVVWDRLTGEPLHNAVVWLDTRTRSTVEKLVARTPTKKTDYYQGKCGLPFSTYFSGVKLRWLLDNKPEIETAHKEGRLMFGNIDSWLIYRLTGGAAGGVHVTDVTNASRTMFMNLRSLTWDDEICSFFEINKDILPRVASSSEVYGHFADGPLKGFPISGDLGDQQAAFVGQRCTKPGTVKNTYVRSGVPTVRLFSLFTRP